MMPEHNLIAVGDCWCDPTVEAEDFNGEETPVTTHYENGEPLFHCFGTDGVPICADCGNVLDGLMRDPDLIATGNTAWWWRAKSTPSLGVTTSHFDDHLVVTVYLWRRVLHLNLFGERFERVDEGDGERMIAEIEAHLRTHGQESGEC